MQTINHVKRYINLITYDTLNCHGHLVDLQSPKVMGVLNFNEDSFYPASRIKAIDDMIYSADKMIKEGAWFIDIGAMSSRPGSKILSEDEELKRIKIYFSELKSTFPKALISVDTLHSKVAEWVLSHGAAMINDISGGMYDKDMLHVVGKYPVPFVIMHMEGLPETMQNDPHYENVVLSVFDYFTERIESAKKANIVDLILDPGIGFGKTIVHNFSLLHYLDAYDVLRFPILVGVSRKSFIRNVLDVNVEEALNGTTAVHMLALAKGAKILRVHDVKEAVQCIKIWEEFNSDNIVNMEF
ncbi:dihydropteroate synthase [Membranihabitans marinus]|uniref:dihydropteroate synthase n=1 Tax=Membranihabitans marinus TaxID=1227546 RepID=UPI001F008C28|nr:dihydropteroate synthase [Membranihabitans marinus]